MGVAGSDEKGMPRYNFQSSLPEVTQDFFDQDGHYKQIDFDPNTFNKEIYSTKPEIDISETNSHLAVENKARSIDKNDALLGKRLPEELGNLNSANLEVPVNRIASSNPFEGFINPPNLKMLKQASNSSSRVPSPARDHTNLIGNIVQNREGFNGLEDFMDNSKEDFSSFKFEDE